MGNATTAAGPAARRTSPTGAAPRWRVADGEEARLTPGAAFAAEIRSRGALPLRPRREALHHARPAFAGTAVLLGDDTYEVVDEREEGDDTVYGLRAWPEGEVFRDRVAYGGALVGRVLAGRQAARRHARVRPFRFLVYPLVGLLPEPHQTWACERLGLYAVTATLVSGLAESGLVMALLTSLGADADDGKAIALVLAAPGLVLFVLPGLGRAASAMLLRETGGSPFAAAVLAVLDAVRRLPRAAPEGFVPLTRDTFWARLAQGDALEPQADGSVVVRGTLPHLTWEDRPRLESQGDYWQVEALGPEWRGTEPRYAYRLLPLGEPPAEEEAPPAVPPASAYADEVMGAVRLEWDAWNTGFAWLTSLLASDVQERAFAHRGGPAAARRPTLATAAAGALVAVYLLHFLPGPPGDPLAPFVAVAGVLLLVDAARRVAAARAGRYAPSLLRWLLPSNVLPPERLAFHAHRDAERETVRTLRGA